MSRPWIRRHQQQVIHERKEKYLLQERKEWKGMEGNVGNSLFLDSVQFAATQFLFLVKILREVWVGIHQVVFWPQTVLGPENPEI